MARGGGRDFFSSVAPPQLRGQAGATAGAVPALSAFPVGSILEPAGYINAGTPIMEEFRHSGLLVHAEAAGAGTFFEE